MTALLRDIMMKFTLLNSNQVFHVIAETYHGSHKVYFQQSKEMEDSATQHMAAIVMYHLVFEYNATNGKRKKSSSKAIFPDNTYMLPSSNQSSLSSQVGWPSALIPTSMMIMTKNYVPYAVATQRRVGGDERLWWQESTKSWRRIRKYLWHWCRYRCWFHGHRGLYQSHEWGSNSN